MVKKLSVECDFGGKPIRTNLYIGEPAEGSTPLNFQEKVIAAKGGSVPNYLIDALNKIHEISKKNRVNFDAVVEYAIKEIEQFEWLKELQQTDGSGDS